MNNKYCPGCGRHCDLTNPNCGFGINFKKSQEQNNSNDFQNEESSKLEDKSQKAKEVNNNRSHEHLEIEDKLIKNLRELGHIIRFSSSGKGSQKRILTILSKNNKITQRELTEKLGIQPGSASEVIGKLEHSGLIERIPSQEDLRTSDIVLTKSGKELAEEAINERQKQEQEMFSCLSKSEKESLLVLLEKLNASWQSLNQDNYHHLSHHHQNRKNHQDRRDHNV